MKTKPMDKEDLIDHGADESKEDAKGTVVAKKGGNKRVSAKGAGLLANLLKNKSKADDSEDVTDNGADEAKEKS